MIAYACGSGGVVFVPETIKKETVKKVIEVPLGNSNDNLDDEDQS